MSLNKQIKVLMFDMDGTLINHECEMSNEVKEMLKELKKSDYMLCLNSGRPYAMSKRVLEGFGVMDCFDYVFGCNGSEFFDPTLKEVVMLKSLEPSTINDISKLFKCKGMVVCLVGNTVLNTDRKCELEIAEYYARTRKIEMKQIDFAKLDKPWPKALGMLDNDTIDEVKTIISSLDDPRFDAYFSNPNLLEFVPKHVSKFDACEKLMSIIPGLKADEILSFGDADNDVPMLQKTVGVLMGNAKKELHSLDLLKTDSVDENGVYNFLKGASFF